MKKKLKNKFVIFPCNGVGQVGANIARQAAYLIHAKFPDETILSSSPELIVSDKAALRIAKKYPLVLIEGCMQRCGENILYAKGIKPAFIISVPHVSAEKNLSLAGETREKLGPRGRRVVKEIVKVFLIRDRH
ncbi:MAG: putative zinc-binding protein [bacterium]|nr:putative zinc-binding protein [bacterium]